MSETVYDVDYFIRKFEAIPEREWTEGIPVSESGKKCALGFCGVGNYYNRTPEATALSKILLQIVPNENENTVIWAVNDKLTDYRQRTPKARILAALNDIKQRQKGAQ